MSRPGQRKRLDDSSKLSLPEARASIVDSVRNDQLGVSSDPVVRQGDLAAEDLHSLSRNDVADISRPGAFRMAPGCPPITPTSSVDDSSTGARSTNEISSAQPEPEVLMVEADLVADTPEPETTILVDATPVHRKAWIAFYLGVLVIVGVAIAIGVYLGAPPKYEKRTSNPTGTPSLQPSSYRTKTISPTHVPSTSPTASALPSLLPSPFPTTVLESSFRRSLPTSTQQSLERVQTPQARALKWVLWEGQPDFAKIKTRMTQRFALATFYYATGGNSSFDSESGWMKVNSSECTWRGCNCTPGNIVVSLAYDLRGGLDGTLPPELGLLSSLEILRLELQNRLSGSIPEDLGGLHRLRVLNLLFSSLSGWIPNSIFHMSSLAVIELGYNNLSGKLPTLVAASSNVSSLSLSGNSLTGPLPPSIGSMTSLLDLDLSANSLSSSIPSELGKLTRLKSFDLSDNVLRGHIPTELAALTQLRTLRMNNNSLEGSIPDGIGNLSRIRDLEVYLNKLTSAIPRSVGNLSRLTRLVLSNNRLTGRLPTELGLLTDLTADGFFLDSNFFTGPLPTELGQLSRLTDMHLYSNALTGSVPSELCTLLTGVLELYVDCPAIRFNATSCPCHCEP